MRGRMWDQMWDQPCGCVAVWLCGCVAVWLCGCVAVWLCGCVAVWLCGCVAENRPPKALECMTVLGV
jgi:hypothetical protein